MPILPDLFDDIPFGDPGFPLSFEILEEHHGCFEMPFITNDDGFGITLFIPKTEGIDADQSASVSPVQLLAHNFA